MAMLDGATVGPVTEMVPFNLRVDEIRVHDSGLFGTGFGHEPGKPPTARGVLDVRSQEVPFILEHGQIIGRLVFERLTGRRRKVMGRAWVPTISASARSCPSTAGRHDGVYHEGR